MSKNISLDEIKEFWPDKAPNINTVQKYIKKYENEKIVIKYGGNAMADNDLIESFCNDIVFLKQSGLKPVIVHGGGPQIGSMLERLGIKTKFESGMRITDESTLEVVEMVLAGKINKDIASKINSAGGKAVGVSGKDGSMLIAEKLTKQKSLDESNIEKIIDLGFVGVPKKINNELSLEGGDIFVINKDIELIGIDSVNKSVDIILRKNNKALIYGPGTLKSWNINIQGSNDHEINTYRQDNNLLTGCITFFNLNFVPLGDKKPRVEDTMDTSFFSIYFTCISILL